MLKRGMLFVFALLILAGSAQAGKTITLEDKINAGPFPNFHRHGAVEDYIPDEVMIKFRDNVTSTDLAKFQDQMGVKAATRQEAIGAFYQGFGVALKRKTSLGWDKVKIDKGQTVKDVIEQIEKNPLVEKAEPNYRVYAAALSTTYTASSNIDDPFYADGSSMWYFNRTQADQAYDANYVFEGSSDVVVAVVDTGVDLSHPDLAGRLVSGWDFVNGDADPDDDNEYIGSIHIQGHGTHAAGLIAATIDNTAGVAGTGWKSQIKIMPVKVLDSGAGGSLSDLANGINYAVTNGAHIINMSLSAAATSGELASAVTNAHNNGSLLVAAAGNDDVNLMTDPRYPAVYSTVMSIGAVSSNDSITIYSNYSSPTGLVDCVAPGGSLSSIFSGVLFDNDYGVTSTARNDTYSAVDGTSFAAPQVAGLAAMLKLQVPSRTHTEIRALITNYCDTVGNGDTQLYGSGRVNVLESLGVYQTPTPTVSPTNTLTATPTLTATQSATVTMTPTITLTPTESATITVTYTHSPTSTITPTITQTSTITPTSTSTATPLPIELTRDEVKVFPQPAKERIRIAFESAGVVETTLHLYNLVGELVIKIENQAPIMSGSTGIMILDAADVSSGIYFMVLTVKDDQGDRVLKQKVVITK